MWARRHLLCVLLQPPSLRLFSPLFFVAELRLSCAAIVLGVLICYCHLGKFYSSSVLHFAVLQPICLYVLGYVFICSGKVLNLCRRPKCVLESA
jgi:hypothetical protein